MLALLKILAAIICAILIVYSTEKLFVFTLKKFITKSGENKYPWLFLAQAFKFTYFVIAVSLAFSYAPIDKKSFLLSILIYLTINLLKNLLKLLLWKQPI